MPSAVAEIARLLGRNEPQARYTVYDSDGGGAKWPFGLSDSGAPLTIDHWRTRRNARRAMHDTPVARSMVERMADTVADTGLKLELAPIIEVLGITREQADDWAREVSLRFDLYAKDKKAHRSEQMTFYQYQNLYSYCQQRDNDLFTRLFYSRDAGLQNPLQFEAIDPDQIRGDAFTFSHGLQGGPDGINRDDRGREKQYKVWVRGADGNYTERTVDTRGRSGRLHMLHGFRPEYAGQGRGYSRIAHAIQEFENLTDFSASAIKKAINQSSIVGFVEPSKDEDAENPFQDIMTNMGAGPAAQLFGSNPSEVEGIPVKPETIGIDKTYRVPEATVEVPGSMILTNLRRGSTFKFAGNTAPADTYDSFVDAFAGYLSASTGTPLEVVLMKFGQNYSASRATLLLFWRVAVRWRAEMDADLLSPVVEMWLSGEIAAGRISAPGWSDPRLRAAWLNKNWIGSAPPDIDPVKTANANRTNLEMGLTNLERAARDLNGSSAAANIEKNNKLYTGLEPAPWVVRGGAGGDEGQQAQAMIREIHDLLTGG